MTDTSGVINEANHVASELTGRPVHTLLGKPVALLVHEESRSAFRQRMGDIERLRKIEDWEVSWQRTPESGEAEAVKVSLTVQAGKMAGDGEHLWRWLIRDQTELRKIEDDLKRMHNHLVRSEQLNAIGTLAAGLGHDVKNLLFPIRCRLDSLMQQNLPEQAVSDLHGLRHSVVYLQQLANNLQQLAEQPGHVGIGQITTVAEAWWEHVEPMMQLITRRHISLVAQFEPNLPGIAIAPHLLTQVVMNLVKNASEAMECGGHIRLEGRLGDDDGFVELAVTDDGPGMEPQVLRRALNPFFSTKTNTGSMSTGMGLPLVRGIIKSAAGSVRIDSQPNEGTAVLLRLPVAPEGTEGHQFEVSHLPHAAISVRDSHLASTLCTLLQLSRLPSSRCDPYEPGNSRVWIVEPCVTPIDISREYLHNDPNRKLVLFGEKDEHWESLPAVSIESAASLKTIRDTLSEVALDALQRR